MRIVEISAPDLPGAEIPEQVSLFEVFVMNEQIIYAPENGAIEDEVLVTALKDSIRGCKDGLARVLMVVPDYTRYNSNAGRIANIYYHALKDSSRIDILVALGTHMPMTEEECREMYGDIPSGLFIQHNWREDVIKIGEVPREVVYDVSEGTYDNAIDVEINRHLYDGYDIILSVGQVVPHATVGMGGESKNIFVGCGGGNFINSTHIIGAYYGMERQMGKDNGPVRKILDYARDHYLSDLPVWYILTVTTAPKNEIRQHGLFIGKGRDFFEKAVALSQRVNFIATEKPNKKVVVYLNEKEYRSTWLGNKALYHAFMSIADGGELIILAPGVESFGEDVNIDKVIRKYGFCGREKIIELCKTNEDLMNNFAAAGNLIVGSCHKGRFGVTYCTRRLSEEDVKSVYYDYMSYDEAVKKYNPAILKDGINILDDGEEIYYISDPALGLWKHIGYKA